MEVNNFLSQIFPERFAHGHWLDLFLGFRVPFQEGDISALDHQCLPPGSGHEI